MPHDSAAFDHLIHWVADLDTAMTAYNSLGMPTHEAVTMPGFRNAVWGVDDERYLELATVEDWEAAKTSKYAHGLEALTPAIDALGSPGLVTFGVDVPDARATAARLREAGHDVIEDEVYFEDRGVGFIEVYVRDAPPYFPFFITYNPPRTEIARMRAEHRVAEGITFEERPDLVAILARSLNPVADAHQMAALVGCNVTDTTVALPGAEVRFTEGTPVGLYGIVVRGLDPTTAPTKIAGVWIQPEI